jgi:MFS family permease
MGGKGRIQASNTPASATRSRFRDVTRSLRYRNFQLFFSGQLISLVGTWMDNIAEAWLVYRLTGSSLLLGTVAFAGQFPVFLFAPLGGLIADRWNRRKIIIVTQSASMVLAFILSYLTLSERITVNEVIVLAILMGIVNAVDTPTRQSFLVEMVGHEDLMNAIALNSSMFNGARIIGPAIAGVLVASIGEGWCFFANAVSYIAVITGLLLMRVPHRKVEHHASPLEHIIEGFRYVRHTAPIRAVLTLVGLVSLMALPYSVLMPVFAARILHGNARTLGLLMGAMGVGALTGTLVLASRTQVKGLGRVIALASGSFGVCLILFSQSRWIGLSVALLVPAGFSMMTHLASSNTLVQAMVPDRLRGRTMSIYLMMFMGMAPIGSLFAGALAQHIGAPWTLTFGGASAVIGGIVFWRYLPTIRVEARELLVAQGIAEDEPAREMTSDTVS